MKKKLVSLVYVGMGNLTSLVHWIKTVDVDVEIITSYKEWNNPDLLILPGIGAFQVAMARLQERGLIEPIQDYVDAGRPFLGICLGMQLMMDSSEEFGSSRGLGIVSGSVVPLRSFDECGEEKIPHIGWVGVRPVLSNNGSKIFALNRSEPYSSFYFLHSYTCAPIKKEPIIAEYSFGRYTGVSIIGADGQYGCQFHPEKSGVNGIRLLKALIEEERYS